MRCAPPCLCGHDVHDGICGFVETLRGGQVFLRTCRCAAYEPDVHQEVLMNHWEDHPDVPTERPYTTEG